MEPLSPESIYFIYFSIYFLITIDLIAYDWETNRREMDSDLMSTASEEIDLEESILSCKNSLIEKFCFSEFWVCWIYRSHSLAIIRITSYERLNISLTILHDTHNESEICLVNSSFGNFELECMH
jgi:hypothetical protein